MHGLQLGRQLLVAPGPPAAGAGRSARPPRRGGGHRPAPAPSRAGERNCGSSDIMLASAVVPVRGKPLMSTGPGTASASISGCAAYHASTSRRLVRRRRRSPSTAASAVRAAGRRRARGCRAARRGPHGNLPGRSPTARRRPLTSASSASPRGIAAVSTVAPGCVGRRHRDGRGRSARPSGGIPSRQPTRHGPVIAVRLVMSPTEPTRRAGDRRHVHGRLDAEQLAEVGATTAGRSPARRRTSSRSWPARSPRPGAPRAGRRCRRRGSGCRASDPSGCGTGSPAATASRCQAGSPPWSPYAAPIRAMVTGRPNERAQYRATPSCAIFDTEYGADGGSHRVAERIVLAERVPRIGMRLVDAHRRHHQRSLRARGSARG